MCRIRGPAVKGGIGYPSGKFPIEQDYLVDGKTVLVLVSDFRAVSQKMGSKLNEFLRLRKTASMYVF